jgi:hypothetical protein
LSEFSEFGESIATGGVLLLFFDELAKLGILGSKKKCGLGIVRIPAGVALPEPFQNGLGNRQSLVIDVRSARGVSTNVLGIGE